MLIPIYEIQNRISQSINDFPRRYLYNTIKFDQHLVGLLGARGVGKTTLLLQYLKTEFNNPAIALYISADHIHVEALGVMEIVAEHHRNGGKVIVIDEIHKLDKWAQIVKTIYDSYPEMRLIISGSSAFQIKTQGYDLSRRMVYYHLSGLSFREFISLKKKISLPSYSLDDILMKHSEISADLSSRVNIHPLFREYLVSGYYPFWQEDLESYPQKIENIIQKIFYEDIPSAFPIKYDAIRQLKRLLYMIATSDPFQVNISKLANELDIARESLYQYLDFLDQSFVINRLWKPSTGKAYQRKPEKLFLQNTNIISYLNPQAKHSKSGKGTLRETFFVTQFLTKSPLFSSRSADFEDENNNQFEIGGKSKSQGQLDPNKNGYLFLDDISAGHQNIIPLYLIGFLY